MYIKNILFIQNNTFLLLFLKLLFIDLHKIIIYILIYNNSITLFLYNNLNCIK